MKINSILFVLPLVIATACQHSPMAVSYTHLDVYKRQMQLQSLVKDNSSGKQKIVIAKTPLAKPDKDLDRAVDSGSGVVVSFENDAVTLSAPESETLRNTLATIALNGSAKISVTVPKGFSEAKRIGFYRAMAVRNQLIEMKVPADKIDVVITEGAASANNARVLVTSR